MRTILVIGALYNIAFVIFHVFFWRIFSWQSELPKLNRINRHVMPILNLCITFVFLIFAYISVMHTNELLTTPLGKSLLILIALFWFARAIEQIVYFGISNKVSLAFFIIFITGTVIYALPLIANFTSMA